MKPRQRMRAIPGLGCLACRQQGFGLVLAEVHHLTLGGRHGQLRRGDRYTVGLCPWHHRGVVMRHGWTPAEMAACYGPSYAIEPNKFRRVFGSDDALLLAQDQALENVHL